MTLLGRVIGIIDINSTALELISRELSPIGTFRVLTYIFLQMDAKIPNVTAPKEIRYRLLKKCPLISQKIS